MRPASIGGARALGAHVALGGKAGHQVFARGDLSQDRPLRHRLLYGLQVLRAGMQEQMHMRVDQPRQQRALAEIDDLGIRRAIDVRPNRDDPLALDQHLTRRQQTSSNDIQHVRRVQNDWVRRRCLRTKRCEGQEKSEGC